MVKCLMGKNEIALTTSRGGILLCAFCSPKQISSLSFEAAHARYARYRPLVSRKENLLKVARQPDANVTLAHTPEGEIIGFGILEYPSPEERWARVGDRTMMEVSAIEVAPPWRGMGVSKALLTLLTDHPLREVRIFYMVGYSWTWDLDGKGLSALAYRNLLMGLFSKFGFKAFQTNEANVLLRPENLFMARIGSRVSEELKKRFKLVRFDVDRFA